MYVSVFQPFCCSGTQYICDNHLRNPVIHAMIREFNGVSKVEFSGCLRTNVHSEVKRQRTCWSLGQNPQMLTIKQQAKDLLNLTILNHII